MHPSECTVPNIARRDEKAFLSDQCKEIEENKRMGKTRDLFKKNFFFNFCFYFILLYNTVSVLPYIDMNLSRMSVSSQS